MARRGRDALTTKLCRTARTHPCPVSDTMFTHSKLMMTERGMILFLFTLSVLCWAGLV